MRIWEEKRDDFIKELSCILKDNLDNSLFFINSFILSSKFIETFVLDELDLEDKLKYLANKPISEDGICPLIACSEWCRQRFRDRGDREKCNQDLDQTIEDWQKQVIKYRKEVNQDEITKFVNTSFEEFKNRIYQDNILRIQIEIEPEKDTVENTGMSTGSFILNMNLWIKNQDSPLGRFAERLRLEPQAIEESNCDKSKSLEHCLKKEDLLAKLIRKARYSLPSPAKPDIEIFLPLDLYQQSLENICFKRGKKRQPLGKEYPIFINSFERYFDEDYLEIRDEIYEKKQALWNNDDNNLDSQMYYIGKEPSVEYLEIIEEEKAIAVWSRCRENPLIEGDNIQLSEWKNLPQTIHELRKRGEHSEVTLFWDDLYPKPSQRTRPLNTKLVEE